jgi:hypothetical protein
MNGRKRRHEKPAFCRRFNLGPGQWLVKRRDPAFFEYSTQLICLTVQAAKRLIATMLRSFECPGAMLQPQRTDAMICFLDEAGTRFGRCKATRAGGDRCANPQACCLPQRIAAYGGTGILATNPGAAIDLAFLAGQGCRSVCRYPGSPDDGWSASTIG